MNTGRARRAPAALWRAGRRVLVAALPGHPPTTVGGSGALVWRHLADWTDVTALAAALAAETGADPATVERDLMALVDALEPLGLVEREAGAAGEGAP